MEIEQLQKRCLEQGVKYGLASYVDIHGASKGKFVPVDHFAQMFAGSELFTGAALDGVPQDISDDEVAAMPDPDSMQQCQWNPEVAWFASDLFLGGKPFEACSRNILKRNWPGPNRWASPSILASRPNSSCCANPTVVALFQ